MRRGRKIPAILLILILVLSLGINALATDIDVDETGESENPFAEIYNMPVESNGLTNWPQGCSTYGASAIVMEAGTGAILYAKDIDKQQYPASITKLLTTLVALEYAELDDEISFSADSLSFLEWDDAQIGMKEGDVISFDQALYAILLASANEVSYATAESIGKKEGHDYSWFIGQMNEKCQELGCVNSNFVNPHGLHNDNHYTCARDMALISRELFKYPKAFEVMQTPQYTIKKSKTTEEHIFQQNHKMLWEGYWQYYEYAIGGKTGYTDQALSTLVTMTDNGDMPLICVVLRNQGSDIYTETKNLIDYVYTNFQKMPVEGKETSEDVGKILNEGYVVLPEGVPFEELEMEFVPDEKGTEATLVYTYEGNPVGEVRAQMSDAYIKKHSIKEEKKDDKSKDALKKKETSKKERIILAVLTVGLVVLVMLLVSRILAWKRRALRRKRRRQRERDRRRF